MRGGEMVLEELCRLFPRADLFTLVHQKGSVSPLIENRRIAESPLAALPFSRKHYQPYLPLFPWAVEALDLRGYDLIISSSSAVAKGVIPPPDALHLSYVHSPMRYVWDMRTDYFGEEAASPFKRLIAGWCGHYLRNWDAVASMRVDAFVANSHHVRGRIEKYYRRTARVVYPPVDVERFTIGSGGGGYFLSVAALVPYKRIDLAAAACTRLGLRLIVVGKGSEMGYLKKIAGSSVEFIGTQPSEKLVDLYRNAAAFLHPGEEDFGIAPVEAQAAGRPVIAYGRGGALETVVDEGDAPTGVFFNQQNVNALCEVLKDFDADQFKPQDARRNAERFRRERFIEGMKDAIATAWTEFHGNRRNRI